MNFDPTKKEMMNFLKDIYGGEDSWEDDAEVAIYWFANDYHGGQWSNLYSVLSTSPFKPGRNSNGPEEDTLEENMYEDLVSEFGNKKPIVKENKMSRFNLWEKLIKEEDEFDGEVAEMGDEVEDKIEDESGDVIFDMAVNFVLALPEDSVPEDMRTEYDTLMSKIGDDYLGGDDEGEGSEDLEDPKFDMDEEDNLEEEEDEEMKESRDRSSYGVVLPSGTKIQVEDAAEQKRAKKAVDAYVKANPSVGDKALMKLAAMAILMKGEQIKDVIKAYDAATSEKFKEYVQKTK